jgi:hypothetical protein
MRHCFSAGTLAADINRDGKSEHPSKTKIKT